MPRIELTTVLPTSLQKAFEACADPHVHPSTMRRYRERVVATSARGLLAAGDTVTFQARHFGVPWRLTARITDMRAPHSFVDEQVRGPFARLRHEHAFHPLHERACLMIDRIDFAAPFGPIGRLADRVVLEGYMRRLVAERNAGLVRLLDGS